MRALGEKQELLYVIRTMDVLMSSGVGLEAALHTIGRGGYGIISEDFSQMMKRLQKGTGGGIDKELKAMMKKAEPFVKISNCIERLVMQFEPQE